MKEIRTAILDIEKQEERRIDIERKVNIIAWLLPRFYKGISKPEDYEELIGCIETNPYKNE